MEHKPLISIVIPTRDRHETLFFTLQTILNQDFDNYEIVVSDNNSSADTKKVIEKINSNKIKYVRSDIDLSLCDSWEQAVSNARGEYIMGIADNDGIIQGGLKYLETILKINNYPKLINFIKNTYHWPCLEEDIRNTLFLNKNPALKFVDGIKLIEDVLDNNKLFYKLPMIYNSIVHNSLIKKMKEKTNRIFNAGTADVYSGFCLAYLTKKYLLLTNPVTISGNSAKSLGVNYTRNNNAIIKRETKAREKSQIKLNPIIPNVISGSAHIVDCFLQAKENLNINDINIDRKKLMEDILLDIHIFEEVLLIECEKKIINCCSDNEELLNFTYSLLKKYPLKIKNKIKTHIIYGFNKNNLILNGYNFNIHNILDVSNFMHKFYNYTLNTVSFPDITADIGYFEENAEVSIWGNGNVGKDCQKWINKIRPDIKIKYIINSFSENKKATPEIIKPLNIPNNINYIIIASSFMEEISNTIIELGLNKKYKISKYYE